MRFEGTSAYVATDDLKVAVNAAIALERPLLVKGEPGTGKTVLALEVAKAVGAPLIEWHIKSTTKAQQGLYEYDAVSRLRDSQLGEERVKDIRNYIKRGKLWDAFVADERPVLLIDEIDKADIEFPNDLLQELDRMEFFVYETGETIKARRRPVVVITSNNEKELPDAFLRRCFFHYIRFPDPDTMRAIVEVHFPGIKQRLVSEAMKLFYEIRDVPGLKKKPSTSELLDWLKLLMVEDIGPEILRERDPKKLIPPLHGALLKNEQDVHLFERLAFMARREESLDTAAEFESFRATLIGLAVPARDRSAKFLFAFARFAGLAQFAVVKPPIVGLRHRASDPPAGPDQLVGQKHPPGIVAFGDRARDDVARHRGGVEPMAAEPAGKPYLWHQFADLRHAVKRITEHAVPDIVELDLAELRKDALDVAFQLIDELPWIALPGAHAARPHQPVAVDDPVMVVGEIGIAHRPGIGDRLGQVAARAARWSPHRSRSVSACPRPAASRCRRWTLPASTILPARTVA